MAYVIRTDKLSSPHYWAGFAEGSMGLMPIISSMIFDARHLDNRPEAERIVEHLGADWTISETSGLKMSRSLWKAR